MSASPKRGTRQQPTEQERSLNEIFQQIEEATAILDELFTKPKDEIPQDKASAAKQTLSEAVGAFLREGGLSAAYLAVKLGVSDQTVLRWRNWGRVPFDHIYFKARPTKKTLLRLQELVDELTVQHGDEIPIAHFEAVYTVRDHIRPSFKLFQFLCQAERELDIELNVEAAVHLLDAKFTSKQGA